MTLKNKILSITLVLILIGGGMWWWQSRDAGEPIATETVTRGTVSETVSVTGELLPRQYADLSFKRIGQIDALYVVEGETVKAGDPLARLERGVLQAQLEALELTQRIAETNEKLARRDWASLDPEEREAKVLASEKARADVAAARLTLDETVLRAPFDGTVTKIPVRLGETVALSETVLRLAGTSSVSDAPVIIEAKIPESDVAKVKVGMRSKVTFDAFTNDEVFEASVQSVESSATIDQDVVSYVGTFVLDGVIDTRLRDGMTANVDIETGRRDNVLVLPFRALNRQDGKYLVQAETGDSFTEREVKIGLEGDEGEVEIVSGLKEGERVKLTTKSE